MDVRREEQEAEQGTRDRMQWKEEEEPDGDSIDDKHSPLLRNVMIMSL